jgi:hypothetical protein
LINWREAVLNKVFLIVKMLRLDTLFRLRVSVSTYAFTDYFIGFENAQAVQRIFQDECEKVLQNLRVEFSPFVGYMGVNGSNGNLIVNPTYLKYGDKLDVYLDIIHELVHIQQYSAGRELFDSNYSYAQRPTEVEAYHHTVDEARRLNLSDKRICEYLKTPWMSISDLKQLASALDVNC